MATLPTPRSAVTLWRNTTPPAANTAAGAGVLKILVAGCATGTPVDLADLDAGTSKQPYRITLGGTDTALYEANAVVRYLFRASELALDKQIALEELLEWEETTLSALHGSEDLDALLTAADAKVGALGAGDVVGAADAVLLGALYFALTNSKPEVLRRHPELQAWFARLGATTAVAAALPNYEANVSHCDGVIVLKVRVREEP
ncbi:methionine--tRNA ligase mes1, partial [Coemansia spiralis]